MQVRSAKRNAELNGYDDAAFRVLQCGQSLDDPDPVQVQRKAITRLTRYITKEGNKGACEASRVAKLFGKV